jgi:hypothetical protein
MNLERGADILGSGQSAGHNVDHVVPDLPVTAEGQALPLVQNEASLSGFGEQPRTSRRRSERVVSRAPVEYSETALPKQAERKAKRREAAGSEPAAGLAVRSSEQELLHNPEVVALVSEFARYGRPRWFTPERSVPRGMPPRARNDLPIAELLNLLTGASASLGRVVSEQDRWSSALEEFCPPGILELLKSRTDTMYVNPIERGIALVQSNRETRAFLQYLISTLVTPFTDHPLATVSKWLELVSDYLALNADELLLMLIYLVRYIALNAKHPLRGAAENAGSTEQEVLRERRSDIASKAHEPSMTFGLAPSDFERPLFRPIDVSTGKPMRACNEPRAQQWEQVLAVAAYTAVFSLEEFPRRTELEIRDLLGGVRWSMRAAQLLVYDALEWRLLVLEAEYVAVRDLVLQAAIHGEQSPSQLLADTISVVRLERARADRERQTFLRSAGIAPDCWSESSVTSPSMLQYEHVIADEHEKVNDMRRAFLENMNTLSGATAHDEVMIEPLPFSFREWLHM